MAIKYVDIEPEAAKPAPSRAAALKPVPKPEPAAAVEDPVAEPETKRRARKPPGK